MEKYIYTPSYVEITELIEYKYTSIEQFVDGVAWACVDGAEILLVGDICCVDTMPIGRYRAIDTDGNEITGKEFNVCMNISDKTRMAQHKNGKWGYLDLKCRPITAFEYDYARAFEDGFAVAAVQDRYFSIDKKGNRKNEILLRNKPLWFRDDSGLARVDIGGKFGVIKTRGLETVLEANYEQIKPLKMASLIWAKKDGKFGAFEDIGGSKARQIIEHIYDDVSPLDSSRAFVKQENKWGIVNQMGATLTEFVFEAMKICYIGENCFGVSDGEDMEWALVDKNAKLISQYKYDYLHTSISFEKAAVVCRNEVYGLINEYGNELILPKYDSFFHFRGEKKEMAIVCFGRKLGLIDRHFNEVAPFVYEQIGELYGLWMVKKDGKWGVLNDAAQTVLECEYDDIMPFDEEYMYVVKNGRSWLFDRQGNKIQILDKFNGYISIKKVGDGLCALQKENGFWALAKYKIEKAVAFGLSNFGVEDLM